MVEVWDWEKQIVYDELSPFVVAKIANITKESSINLFVSYIKGSEDSVVIIPSGLESDVTNKFPIQRLDAGQLVTINFTLDTDGQYTIPIPMARSWEYLQLDISFVGDTTSPGQVYIVAKPDYRYV